MFHLTKISRSAVASYRLLSSSSEVKSLVGIAVDDEGIATVQMQRAPVNSLNLESLQALHDSICKVEQNKCKGLILTSASPTVFSAGIDLMEFHNPDVKRLAKLKESIFDVAVKLFGSDIITTAAINGYAGAGACILAMACDYRSMTTGKATIGLNDTAAGISPAKWIVDLMTRLMGPRHTEHALTSSFMFPAERALQTGLIDEVASDKMDAVQKCKAFIKSYDHISPAVRADTKRSMRQEYLTELEKNRKQYVTDFVGIMTSPAFQDVIDQYIQNLKKNRALKV